MTKLEIENKVYEYAKRVDYNVKTTDAEVKDRINTAVRDIVAVAFLMSVQGMEFRFGMNQKVNLILAKMRSDIEAIIKKSVRYTKSISRRLNQSMDFDVEDWDSDSWVNSERYGKTYLQRLAVYSNRLKYEYEIYVAVGMVNKMSQLEIANWFMLNIQSPHTVKEILDASGYSAVRASGVLLTGFGGITSAYKSILRLNHDMIKAGYAISNNKTWGKSKLYKYIKTSGGSNVCAVCQGNVGFTFPADQFIVPVHPNCQCSEFPILLT